MTPVIDTHCHLATADLDRYPRSDAAPLATDTYVNEGAAFVAKMDSAGVDLALVVQAFGLYGFDNAYHADAAATEPRFFGICGLSPNDPAAPDALRHWCDERGIVGLRLAYFGRDAVINPQHAGLRALLAGCVELDVPVSFLTTRRNLEAIAQIAARMPELVITLDHLGVVLGNPAKVADAVLTLAPLPNISLKFATPAITAGGAHWTFLRELFDRFGAQRLLWGSDYPHTNQGGYAAMVEAARHALDFLDADETAAVFGGNALKIWPQLTQIAGPHRADPLS